MIRIDTKIGRIREDTTPLNTDEANPQDDTFQASFGTQGQRLHTCNTTSKTSTQHTNHTTHASSTMVVILRAYYG